MRTPRDTPPNTRTSMSGLKKGNRPGDIGPSRADEVRKTRGERAEKRKQMVNAAATALRDTIKAHSERMRQKRDKEQAQEDSNPTGDRRGSNTAVQRRISKLPPGAQKKARGRK